MIVSSRDKFRLQLSFVADNFIFSCRSLYPADSLQPSPHLHFEGHYSLIIFYSLIIYYSLIISYSLIIYYSLIISYSLIIYSVTTVHVSEPYSYTLYTINLTIQLFKFSFHLPLINSFLLWEASILVIGLLFVFTSFGI